MKSVSGYYVRQSRLLSHPIIIVTVLYINYVCIIEHNRKESRGIFGEFPKAFYI